MQIRMQFCCKGVSFSMSRCMTYHLLKFSTTSWNHVFTRSTLYISLPQRSIFTKSPDACKYTCIFGERSVPGHAWTYNMSFSWSLAQLCETIFWRVIHYRPGNFTPHCVVRIHWNWQPKEASCSDRGGGYGALVSES
jgi:hypothetical protein